MTGPRHSWVFESSSAVVCTATVAVFWPAKVVWARWKVILRTALCCAAKLRYPASWLWKAGSAKVHAPA